MPQAIKDCLQEHFHLHSDIGSIIKYAKDSSIVCTLLPNRRALAVSGGDRIFYHNPWQPLLNIKPASLLNIKPNNTKSKPKQNTQTITKTETHQEHGQLKLKPKTSRNHFLLSNTLLKV